MEDQTRKPATEETASSDQQAALGSSSEPAPSASSSVPAFPQHSWDDVLKAAQEAEKAVQEAVHGRAVSANNQT